MLESKMKFDSKGAKNKSKAERMKMDAIETIRDFIFIFDIHVAFGAKKNNSIITICIFACEEKIFCTLLC